MGYDIYAIKPDHVDADPLNNCELLQDPWYAGEREISHPFWRFWREQRTEGGHPIPDDLHLSMRYVSDTPAYALDTAADIERFAQSLPTAGTADADDLLDYAQWIRHWAGKGACFYLSR
jgi:hypothetical protein